MKSIVNARYQRWNRMILGSLVVVEIETAANAMTHGNIASHFMAHGLLYRRKLTTLFNG